MPVIQKVTDPQKIVTDPLVLKELARQGIDKDYVEFIQDYAPRSLGKRHSPYAKFYRDRKSGKEFMVVSGLPMVNAAGDKVEVGWDELETGKKYKLKTNVFDAEIEGKTVTIEALNDQPSGEKQGNRVTFKPQLFLDGVEVLCGVPNLLAVDPINPNYHGNVLEWDYGICKRRLRVIQGRIHGYWIFTQNPNGEVRIKYNQNQPRLKLTGYAISSDEEMITATEFVQAEYPLQIGDSATYYPDAHEETSSVDGHAWEMESAGESWLTIRNGAGNDFNDTAEYFIARITSYSNEDEWSQIDRIILLFDTSGLPDDATISAATLSVYGYLKTDTQPISPTLNVYSSNPSSNTALTGTDYATLGTTAFCDTAITYAGFNTGDPGTINDFVLNASGLAAISKTSVSKFGLREATYDVPINNPPDWASIKDAYFAPHSADKGVGYKPKLVVTYSIPEVAKPTFRLDPKPRTRARFYPSLKLGG